MTKFKHIVQVHPVEHGKPNLHKVKREVEFDSKEEAVEYVENTPPDNKNPSRLFTVVA